MSSADELDEFGGPTDPLEWLFSLQRFGMEPGLARTEALLAAVGAPQSSMRVVLVGGTNGKGSVTAVLAACLQAAGRRTGSFFSPHLQRVGERAKVDGVEATRDELRRAVAAVRPHATAFGATFFEVVTVAALLRFREAGARWLVMEVGLGGRLDATNALEPALSIITPIGLDHTAVLGPDLKSIAGEKAGILRPGVPTLTAAKGEALVAIEAVADGLGTPLAVLGREFSVELLEQGWGGITVAIEAGPETASGRQAGGHGGSWEAPAGLPLRLRSPLLGAHQADNVALAAVAALQLGVDPGQVRAAVAATRWPGRLEVIEYERRRFVLDGAHNPQAAKALAAALERLDAHVAALVLGVSADKDLAEVARPMLGLATTVIATKAALSPRGLEPEELAARLASHGQLLVSRTPKEALEQALAATAAGSTIVVAGSLFLVGEFRTLLSGGRDEPGQRWQ